MGQGMSYDEIEERLLEAASRLLIRYGYDKTTLDDVAREAGLSRSTLYTRWKKKDTLFRALIWRESLRYIDDVIEHLAQEHEAGTLVGFFGLAMRLIRENAFMETLYTRDRHVFGTLLLRDNVTQLYVWRINITVSFLTMMQQVGMMRPDVDIKTLAYVLSSLQFGILKLGEIMPDEQSPPMAAVVQQVVQMMNVYAAPEQVDAEHGREALITYMQTLRDQLQAAGEGFSPKG